MPGEDVAARREAHALELSAALGALIKAERERRDWTAAQLAERLGMRQSGVSTWENGGRHFGGLHIHNVMALEDVFELPRGAIFKRLHAVEDDTDFETFVMSRRELNLAQKGAFRELYRAFVVKEWTG